MGGGGGVNQPQSYKGSSFYVGWMRGMQLFPLSPCNTWAVFLVHAIHIPWNVVYVFKMHVANAFMCDKALSLGLPPTNYTIYMWCVGAIWLVFFNALQLLLIRYTQ